MGYQDLPDHLSPPSLGLEPLRSDEHLSHGIPKRSIDAGHGRIERGPHELAFIRALRVMQSEQRFEWPAVDSGQGAVAGDHSRCYFVDRMSH
jgi:hypothetical protein